MPYPTPFVLLTIFGRFGDPANPETWSTSCKIGNLSDTVDPTGFLAAVAPAIKTFHTTAGLGVGTKTFLTELHGAVIGTDGHYVGGATQATKVYSYAPAAAGSGTGLLPWTNACVLSLRSSSVTRGPASHGRMYYPFPARPVDGTTGRWTTGVGGDAEAISLAAKTMLQAINTQATASFGPGAAIYLMSKVGAGSKSKVDRLLVGSRADTQERRENATVETYVTQTI